ncbi:hypothetical protein Mgra_00003772 [Meloidogyne graminicola]|uniref:Uncharacterized protein n=1 Tax=Meloidogyne graminicola TaxID=189291 RepID=A0A8S9ZUG0_9BILA|nr:hypothetical protein Mgra_00003772 [Meloidogyne graminicola]
MPKMVIRMLVSVYSSKFVSSLPLEYREYNPRSHPPAYNWDTNKIIKPYKIRGDEQQRIQFFYQNKLDKKNKLKNK